MINTGLIPTIYRRIICYLWKGHKYKPVSPKDIEGRALFECTYCQKQKVI